MHLRLHFRIGLVYKPLRPAPVPSQLHLRDNHQRTAQSPESSPDDTMRYVVKSADRVYGKVRYLTLSLISLHLLTLVRLAGVHQGCRRGF